MHGFKGVYYLVKQEFFKVVGHEVKSTLTDMLNVDLICIIAV